VAIILVPLLQCEAILTPILKTDTGMIRTIPMAVEEILMLAMEVLVAEEIHMLVVEALVAEEIHMLVVEALVVEALVAEGIRMLAEAAIRTAVEEETHTPEEEIRMLVAVPLEETPMLVAVSPAAAILTATKQ
jgi:hypothetical protein